MGKEDNFWEHGTGPCGPCSEIYFDRGEEKGCGKPDCKPGWTVTDIWSFGIWYLHSLIKTKTEIIHHLIRKILISMGLERLACIMQGVDSLSRWIQFAIFLVVFVKLQMKLMVLMLKMFLFELLLTI